MNISQTILLEWRTPSTLAMWLNGNQFFKKSTAPCNQHEKRFKYKMLWSPKKEATNYL